MGIKGIGIILILVTAIGAQLSLEGRHLQQAKEKLMDAEDILDVAQETLRSAEIEQEDAVLKVALAAQPARLARGDANRAIKQSASGEPDEALELKASQKQGVLSKAQERLSVAEKDLLEAQVAVKAQTEKVKLARKAAEAEAKKNKEKGGVRTVVKQRTDKDTALELIQTGENSTIPGGLDLFSVGGMKIDPNEDMEKNISQDEIKRKLFLLVMDTQGRLEKIAQWYKQQRENSLEGVYSKKNMVQVRQKHVERLGRAKSDTAKYIDAANKKYYIYKGFVEEQVLSKVQWKKVGIWHEEQVNRASTQLAQYEAEVRKNYDRLRLRNKTRTLQRVARLELARTNAKKEIAKVREEAEKQDAKLRTMLIVDKPAKLEYDVYFDDSIFGA